MVPDDVIADIAGQAIDILLHGPESAQKNDIVKTFTHTSIPIHPCTLLKQRAKSLTHQTSRLRLLVLSCPMWRWATARSFADAHQDRSTSKAFSPRTVLTENIYRCVQRILQHFPTTMAFLTTSTITFSCLASAVLQADSW